MKNKPNKINIITLGCSKNSVDSEMIAGKFNNNNFETTHEYDGGNIVIINTCGFINDAKQESIDTILLYLDLKKRKKIDKLYVIGCLVERYKNDLSKELKKVDKWFALNEYDELFKELNINNVTKFDNFRTLSTPEHYAYLKISEGCDRKCSFCAIPLIRGKQVSRTIESLVSESELLAQKGVKELILIAQDLTSYGTDIYKKRELATLINKLSEIEKIEWIRLHYAYPANFPDEVIEVIKNNKKVCKYLDIPIQHINDEILQSMKRFHSKKDTISLIEKLRKEIPNISIRTTLIVGYPNETKEQFEELKKFVETIKFDRLGVFSFSPEIDTQAYLLPDNVSEDEKELRLEEIMILQQDISLENNKKLIDKKLKTIIDEQTDDGYLGRTEFDSPEVDNSVKIITNEKLDIGKFYNIKIVNADFYDIFGEIL